MSKISTISIATGMLSVIAILAVLLVAHELIYVWFVNPKSMDHLIGSTEQGWMYRSWFNYTASGFVQIGIYLLVAILPMRFRTWRVFWIQLGVIVGSIIVANLI
ncbi:MAG: hypothetical protein EP340_02925 [Alphaproteobacteria bacterium]|nr:MAG: hypothetical protein EP340_02925 [Alphaproteobacteria bacterium]